MRETKKDDRTKPNIDPLICPGCRFFPCKCPSASTASSEQKTAEETKLQSNSHEEKFNRTHYVPHAIVYVWLGGPVPQALREKMTLLKNEGHELYLVHDLETTSAANNSLYATEEIGVTLIQFTQALCERILLNRNFNLREINILWKAYQYQYYGHSLGTSAPPSAVCRNFAAAADIARLIGLLILEEIAPQEIQHLFYSDHDVMPLSQMMNPAQNYGLQLHQFRGKYSLVGQGNVENPGLGLNNAVIRFERGKKEVELISRALSLIVERYTAFFMLAPLDQARCMHKLSGWVRVMMTLFLGGPHIFETLNWQQQPEEDFLWSFLYDTAENELNADFENDSTRTWSAPYQPSAYSEEAILYLLSSMVQRLFKESPELQNILQLSVTPRVAMSATLRSMDFPEATIRKLSESQDLNTFIFRDLQEAKQFAIQYPDNPCFQLADIENEESRQALFAKWISLQHNLGDQIPITHPSPNMRSLLLTNSGLFRRLENEYLTEHRHEDPRLQHAYDEKFGLVLKT